MAPTLKDFAFLTFTYAVSACVAYANDYPRIGNFSAFFTCLGIASMILEKNHWHTQNKPCNPPPRSLMLFSSPSSLVLTDDDSLQRRVSNKM